MSNGRSDSAISLSSGRVPTNNNNNYHRNNGKNSASKKDNDRRSQSQKHQRQTNRGKQNNSNQRPSTDAADPAAVQSRSDEDVDVNALLSTPTKKPARNSRKQKQQQQKIVLLTRDAPESEQQALLAKLSASASSPASAPGNASSNRTPNKRSNRRRQATPPRADESAIVSSYSVPSLPAHAQQTQQQQRTPTRRPANASVSAGRQRPLSGSNLSTIYSPTPRMGHYQQPQPQPQQQQQSLASVAGVPGFVGGSPAVSKSNHYAGCSFNNSPAPNTLPLPRVFMTSPSSVSPQATVRDEDVFSVPVPSGPMSPDQLLAQQRQYTQYQQQRQSMPLFPVLQGNNVNAALDERSRQLEGMMLFGNAQHLVQSKSPPPQQQHVMLNHFGSQSSVDLSQSASDMTSMFQKLRLIKEIAQNRASTVSPLPASSVAVALSQHQQQNQQLAPVYNA
ncbi:hypothetical protein FB645_002342 [Coemansia sp. IMI 203386]|nr:hypothetical protein FB645_002342 [Coemansia sp. IMI 203386]